ncbi:hypothetical protein DAPPUDRAFT_304793 [Daphnia pulex]|uniref:Uncharacterized protein n=1 Tax=Daphnia pulex TaxID=6669 RepID=E9FUW8_DAPPU|nr:hypothetical protein DAPPUDRAFT_304793 [Daphnia pulex]|eukprot:EFX88845.1 hypothetical protein DAPPUDRAFT_304793 [Daphnia pulex]
MPLEIVKSLANSERPKCDIEFIDIQNDRLFTSSEGGNVKIWNKEDLKAVGELNANQCPVTCIAVKGNLLYAGTSGGNIVVWDIEKNTIIRELNEHQGSLAKIRVLGDLVASGDTEGKVRVWQGDTLVHLYETSEEVWDFDLTDDHLYSIRDRDLLVQKIQKTERGHQLSTTKVLEARGPMCRLDGSIAVLSRDGMDIHILEDDKAHFKRIGIIKGQDRIINALACGQQPKTHLYSGGWDNTVRSYDLQTFTPLSRLDVGQAVNCIRPDPSSSGHIFVGGNNGTLCKVLDR